MHEQTIYPKFYPNPIKTKANLFLSLSPSSSLWLDRVIGFYACSKPLSSAMVSIRRRKLLGLCSGRKSFSLPLPLVTFVEKETNANQPKEDNSKVQHGPSNASGSSSSKEQQIQEYPEVKRRKRHRRKQVENQETCLMRGVYFKNMKWQAAIKVDKKQIHLGTVASQEEAARLYDRAAFMCGREPNFELSEVEKQELSKFKWDEFLANTRSAITRPRRRIGVGAPIKGKLSLQYSDWEGVEPDTSAS